MLLSMTSMTLMPMATQVAPHNDFEISGLQPVCPIRFQGDVSYLGHFDSLSKLELVGDFLPAKLMGLEKLSSLRHLTIEGTPQEPGGSLELDLMADLEWLPPLPLLESLRIRLPRLSNLAPLSRLSALRSLRIGNCGGAPNTVHTT